eukprot:4946438-Amphidinium_carterae.2
MEVRHSWGPAAQQTQDHAACAESVQTGECAPGSELADLHNMRVCHLVVPPMVVATPYTDQGALSEVLRTQLLDVSVSMAD